MRLCKMENSTRQTCPSCPEGKHSVRHKLKHSLARCSNRSVKKSMEDLKQTADSIRER